MMRDEPTRLLAALRQAGCDCFIDDDQLFVSPPLRPVDWPYDDVETAIDEWDAELFQLVQHERMTVH
jgi:hypothetical protein